MKFLTIEQIKFQCRIELDQNDEDTQLEFYGRAAESMVVKDLNRNVYIDQVPEDDSTGTVISDDIRSAMLLVVTDLYENRGTTSDHQIFQTNTYQALTSYHRIPPV